MIPDHYTIQFDTNFKQVCQQMRSRFERFAIVESATGEAKTHNYDLPVDDEEVTGQRFKKVEVKEIDTLKRWSRPRQYQLATFDERWDERLLAPTVAPTGRHTAAHSNAYARRLDAVFLNVAFGINYVGRDGVTPANIPAANSIPVDFVHTGTSSQSGLTIEKIIEAKKILMQNEAFNDDRQAMGINLYGVMTPEMETNLLYLANGNGNAGSNRLFSNDFLPPVLDERGQIKSFLGINWIRSNQILADSLDPSIKFAGIWTSDAVHLDHWESMSTSVDVRPDLSKAIQHLSQYSLGGCRSEDKKVVKIACATNF